MNEIPPKISERLDEPTGRHVILVVNPVEYGKLEYAAPLRDKLVRPGVLVLPDNLPLNAHPLLRDLDLASHWGRGNVLTQNPYYLNRYHSDLEPHHEFAMDRLRIMVRLAHLLGAREFEYEKGGSERKTSWLKGNLKAKAPVTGEISAETIKALKAGTRLEHRFSGGSADIASARDLLRSVNLHNDTMLNQLIDLRSTDNDHKSATEYFDLLQESSRNIKMALDVRQRIGVKLGAGIGKESTASYWAKFTIRY